MQLFYTNLLVIINFIKHIDNFFIFDIMKIKENIMTLIEKLLKSVSDDGCYKMANLYVGWIAVNYSVEFPTETRYRLIKKMQGPIICYKAPLSTIYTRVSNGIQYEKDIGTNNSLEVGDSYFDSVTPFIDFVHTYMYGFEKATKQQYLDKTSIVNLENLLQSHIQEQQDEQTQKQY